MLLSDFIGLEGNLYCDAHAQHIENIIASSGGDRRGVFMENNAGGGQTQRRVRA